MTDNVRKIFDMLGVEPNEKFKIYDGYNEFNETFYINEELFIVDNNGYKISVLSNLLNGTYLIIKLPKEPKKKKIGDLTLREAKEMQDKICNVIIGCKDCPFYDCCINDCIDLDQEIEVEE